VTSVQLRTRIGQFLMTVNEPYDLVENVDAAGQISVHASCVSQPLALAEAVKGVVLTGLDNCWQQEQGYNRIRDWGRAMIGFATLMAFNQTSESNQYQAFVADIVVRISRWYHTTTGFYTPMQPYAASIVQHTWGTISDLFQQYGHPGTVARIVYYQGVGYKLKQIGRTTNSRVWLPNGGTQLFPTATLSTDQAGTTPLTRNSFQHEIPLADLFGMIRFDPSTQQAY
jgi:hypothetical protein